MKTVKEKIRDREPVFGTMISEMACPNLARIFKAAGFAYMIVDCEHGYFDYSQLAAMVSVANGAGIGAVVRIPTIDRGVITKVLDMGADGLLVPMVNTADEARQIVSYAKYPPLDTGGRPPSGPIPITTRRSLRSILRSPTPEPLFWHRSRPDRPWTMWARSPRWRESTRW